MNVRIEKNFQVPVWDDVIRQKAIDFWSRRRIAFSETSEDKLVGKRGNLFGNLTSFDMSKLIAELTIIASEQNEVHCILDVNTVLQQITEYNKTWWTLEMDTFESFLLRDDEQEEKWKTFGIRYKKAAWAWSLSNGAKGNKMPPEDRP